MQNDIQYTRGEPQGRLWRGLFNNESILIQMLPSEAVVHEKHYLADQAFLLYSEGLGASSLTAYNKVYISGVFLLVLYPPQLKVV